MKAWKPPKNPVFDNGPGGANNPLSPGSIGTKDELNRLKDVFRRLEKRETPSPRIPSKLTAESLSQAIQGGRAQRFYPFLLVRNGLRDNGTRPLAVSTPPNASPDIWVVPGQPSKLPELPDVPSLPMPYYQTPRVVASGNPYTIYAHVWNLGLAPAIGVTVEFYYHAQTTYLKGAPILGSVTRRIGMARIDLAPRISPECHKLVKCPEPVFPVSKERQKSKVSSSPEPDFQNLYVRVACVGDPPTADWSPLKDRHIACHLFPVI